MRAWNELSMAEKADVMKLAIDGGVYDLDAIRSGYNEYAKGGKIHIDPSKKGTFTAAASKHGKSVQQFASQVLAHPENYSPAMRKKANFARNAAKWKHGLGGNLFDGTSQPTQKMQISRPYYSYDENGRKIDDTLNYNISFPEVVIIPDSKKSPAERAILERERRRNNDAYYGNGTYNAKADREQTELEKIASQKAWENSVEKQALDYAQAAASGIGIGADIVSGLPIYSSLKGARVLSEAETPMGYAEGALWLAPIAGVAGREAWNTGKQAVSEAITKGGFTISTPYLGKTLGKTTAWIPTNRNPFKGISWMVTGKSTPEGLPVEYITSKYSGEGRKLYDEGIKLAQNQGDMGLLVGDNLLSAPKSYSTYEHWYPNRVYVDDQGFWTNRNMVSNPNMKGRSVYSLEDFLAETKSHPDEKIMFSGAPRYRLETPSTHFSEGNPGIRYDMPNNDIIIESNTSANPNIPFDEAWLAASKGRHQMSNLVGSGDYASRVRQTYQDNGIPVNQADFEVLQAKQGIEDSNLKVVPNLKSENGEVLNGQYDPNTRQVLVSQDRDNILDVVESSGHEHAHASEVEKLLELLKEKWKHIKPRKEAFTRSDGSIDTEWKDYISKIVEMRAPAMSVWSEMKELGFNKVGDYLHHLKRFGLEDKQWEALVNRYGLTNAKYMVETVFGVSPFVINGINNEEKDSTTM